MPLDFSQAIPSLCARLNSRVAGELVFWSEAELYQRASESQKRLARLANLFVMSDESLDVVADEAIVALPARHLATLLVALDGHLLTPASVLEMEAFDCNWEETLAATNLEVDSWVGDYLGQNFIRLYRIPVDSGNLLMVVALYPEDITAVLPKTLIPEPLGDYLALAALMEARSKDTDARMPEVAAHLGERLKLYEQAIAAYWGGGF